MVCIYVLGSYLILEQVVIYQTLKICSVIGLTSSVSFASIKHGNGKVPGCDLLSAIFMTIALTVCFRIGYYP